MKEKGILYFEEDDASQLGTNGKQVFVTKRINGKTAHNKLTEENVKQLKSEKEIDDNEIIIGLNRFYIPDELVIETKKDKRKTTTKSSIKKEKVETKSTQKERNKSNTNKKATTKSSKRSNKNKSNTNKKAATKSSKKTNKNKSNRSKENKRKARKKHHIFSKIFILLIIIIGTIIFALVSPTFNIQTITVQGNAKISTETIISLSQLQTGENIFRNLKSEIINNIKEEPYINSVEIKRVLPGTIEITVEERSVAYQIQVIDSYVYIDYQGYILEKSSEQDDVPILTGMATSQNELLNEKRLVSDDITKLNVILKIVENAKKLDIYDLITEINTEDDEYILYLESEKKYIYLGDGSNIANKMMYAQIIIENEKGNSGKAMINGDLDNGFNPYFSEEDI